MTRTVKLRIRKFIIQLTSGVVVILGDRRSVGVFDSAVFGDRSIERREFCTGEGVARREFCTGDGEPGSGFDTPLPNLLTLGVAREVLFCEPSDIPDLLNTQISESHKIKSKDSQPKMQVNPQTLTFK